MAFSVISDKEGTNSGVPGVPFKLQAVREEELGLKGLRVRGLKPELLCQFPVESQNALVEAVAADLDIACLLAVVKAQQGAFPVGLGLVESDIEVGPEAAGLGVFVV